MALPTTSLSFSALQTEFGGSNPISLSEYYRGGSYVPSGTTSSYGTIPTSGAINLGVFRGTSDSVYLDTQTVTVSGYEIINYEIGYYENGYGYSSSYPYGSISDGTSNIYGGGAITDLNYVQYGLSSASVALGISGATNSGWTTMTIGTTSFSRASADIYGFHNGSGFWTWNVAVGANPFGTSGSKAVYWT